MKGFPTIRGYFSVPFVQRKRQPRPAVSESISILKVYIFKGIQLSEATFQCCPFLCCFQLSIALFFSHVVGKASWECHIGSVMHEACHERSTIRNFLLTRRNVIWQSHISAAFHLQIVEPNVLCTKHWSF